MKKWLFSLLFLALFSGCFARTHMMTKEGYSSTLLGTPMSEVQTKYGQPYAIYTLKEGGHEYEYIERLEMGNELIAENHYFFTVVNGQVTRKRMTRELRPAYDLLYQEDPNYSTYP